MTTNSFIPREKLTSYQRWKMDSLETSDLIQKKHSTKGQSDAQVNKQITLPTDAEIAAIFQNARKDGYAAGFQEGTEKGYTEGKKVAEAEIKNEATHLQTLLSHLNQDLQRLDQEVADELLSLAIALSKKMIGRALIIKPEFILPIVQDAIKNLPCVLQQPRLYLHPDDAKIIRSHMENQLAQDNWSIREDEQLLPGGCRIEVNGSEIDASLEVRWQKILSALGQNADWLEKMTNPGRHQQWNNYLNNCAQLIAPCNPLLLSGTITRVSGLVIEAVGLRLAVGSSCTIYLSNGYSASAEVVGFAGDRLFLMPSSDVYGLSPGAKVVATEIVADPPKLGNYFHPRRRAADRAKHVAVGPELLGRVLNGLGEPLDQLGSTRAEHNVPLYSRPYNPLERIPVTQPLDVGVCAINALLTVGRGQRMGLFAGSGVGKSVLLGMMARYTTADVIVVGLIGERGREVKDFIENILGEEGLARSVVIAAPADTSPLLRLQGAAYATAIAEYFRDSGKHVLLIMDSLTRYAMAQREISLAIGEPPATKGYPPSVFAKLPQLVERAGNGNHNSGSITAFYTVLAEGDDQNDPIVDSARAILDGHIVLSRRLAEAGHYPAIDIEASISRTMTSVVSQQQIHMARQFKNLYSRYQRSHDLISVGAYVPGSDPELDWAIKLYPAFEQFLNQEMSQRESLTDSIEKLTRLFDSE